MVMHGRNLVHELGYVRIITGEPAVKFIILVIFMVVSVQNFLTN